MKYILRKSILAAVRSMQKKSMIEIGPQSPESYVKENGSFPITETIKNANGDKVIITGDGKGYFIRYTFSE